MSRDRLEIPYPIRTSIQFKLLTEAGTNNQSKLSTQNNTITLVSQPGTSSSS